MADVSPSPSRDAALFTLTGDRDGRVYALVIVVLMHLLLYLALPRTAVIPPAAVSAPPQYFDIRLEPLADDPELTDRYVRAAPNVASEVPDATPNISDRDQVAAQDEIHALSPDNTPFSEGDMAESERLIQGDPFQQPTPAAVPVQGALAAETPLPRMEPAPADVAAAVPEALTWDTPLTDAGLLARPEVEPPADTEQQAERTAAIAATQTSPDDGTGSDAFRLQPATSDEATVQSRRPRPVVERDTSFGPLKDNRTGAIRIGNLAFDARYSEFGEYWRRVAEIIERRWRSLVYNSRSLTHSRTHVSIQFHITRQGQVRQVAIVESSASKLAETIAQDAITAEAPFFPWTPDMILTMGEFAECGITFFY
jgi:hypothetical protein